MKLVRTVTTQDASSTIHQIINQSTDFIIGFLFISIFSRILIIVVSTSPTKKNDADFHDQKVATW